MELNQEQIQKLQHLGIKLNENKRLPPFLREDVEPARQEGFKFPIFPLLSISGLTILSFSGLILFKNKSQNITPQTKSPIKNTEPAEVPTQVPKSIQHYLLTSQQYFSSALQQQSTNISPKPTGEGGQTTIELLNKSILAATEAIKEFPSDYRGFFQRGRIYQSLLQSQPQLTNQALSDLSQAQKLNPSSAEITRTLASLYAFKGDAQNTINFLNQTITLEPTKAQNFYDLAKIQQQVGLIPQALDTYNRLITLVTDSNQKTQIESELSSLEKIISQNPRLAETSVKADPNTPTTSPTLRLDENLLESGTIQALAQNNLIIATPETIDKVEVSNITSSNALSGTATLPANQKEINIQNSNLSTSSQVYVTILQGGKNQNLRVLSKSKDSFIVGLSNPISENIEFKWWIIN